MFDYVRISAIVPKTKVGDVIHNTEDITKKIRYAIDKGADIVITPELSLTGATCGDLFFQKELYDSAKAGLIKILSETKDYNETIIIGTPLIIDNKLLNCGVVCAKGKIYGIIPKATSDRHFSVIDNTEICAGSLGLQEEYPIFVGNDLIFNIKGEVMLGAEIGEEIFAPVSRGTLLALSGAEIVASLSAGCETAEKANVRSELIKSQSLKSQCVCAYVSAGCDESTSDVVYSGKSIVCENGETVKENLFSADGDYVMICDTDLGKIRADRLKSHNSALTFDTRTVFIPHGEFKSEGEYAVFEKLPFIPSKKEKRLEYCEKIFRLQAMGLKKRIEITNGRPVIGISGGLDSTLALLVCAEAVRMLEKSEKEIVAVTMPGFGTTDRTYTNALTLMKTLGVTVKEISIKEACIQHFSDIGHDINVHDVTYENAQARERTQILMDIANQVNGFVIGTGDLSELALGWCTYNGDQMSMYGVNAGVPKTLIRWIIDSVVEKNIFENSNEVLKDILDTPISPELLPPDAQGKIAQKTEDLVGPYALHDFFLYYVLRYGYSPKKIFFMAKKAFEKDFDGDTILKWEKVFYRRFFSQQFKRSCMPDGVRVLEVGLSPKGDLCMPSDATSRIWLEAIEKL